jgi:NADH dehydrogenase [ubiquinone] 1 alpha subcomplex assembly factor 7
LPERLDAFMARANATYYATHDPFRDFTTAPEISQMFGELLGAWAAVTWRQLGAPDSVVLAEAGPGRGTLMADARRTTARVAPDFHAAAQVHFIETSQRLRAAQRGNVPDASWHDDLDTLPDGKLILIANEFLDALPIRQFVRAEGAWHERHVDNGQFVLRPAPGAPDLPASADGAVAEYDEAGLTWIATLARRLSAAGGAALILDYGPAASAPGDSLQALRHGRPADPLAAPGEADLTAHVDFQALASAARDAGAAAWGPVPQGIFLNRLGLPQRTEKLAAANPGREAALREAADRLANPSRMGHLFKALAITHPGADTPPGFAP